MARTLPLAALALLLTVLPGSAGPLKCTCRDGQACYHWLNAPVSPPNDPCHCPRCRAAPGTCEKILPEGWDQACASNSKMECFLRRHAASWKLACSERLAGTCSCDNPHPERCPKCGKKGEAWGEEEFPTLRRQLEVERRMFGKRAKLVIVRSPNFYVVTDIRSLKIVTQERAPRTMKMHEIAHVFLQRAEIAREDFIRYFGDDIYMERPSAIYLVAKERTKRDLAEKYFGLPEPELFYGGNVQTIGGGFGWNGCAISLQKYRTDHDLQHQMRHLIGHLLASCLKKATGENRYLPRWVYAGAGHWLSRLPAKYRDDANFCAGEGREVRHNGKKWNEMLISKAMGGKLHAVQTVFDVNALGGLDLQMHVRAWSWFDVFLEDDREAFVAFVMKLRDGTDHRVALKETFGISPEEWDRRWRERLLGKRASAAPTVEELDEADPEAAGVAEREAIRTETDPGILAAKIRGLRIVEDLRTAATIVPFLRHESDLVRETTVLVLSRTTAEPVKAYLREKALSWTTGVGKAYAARVLGNLRDAAAVPYLLEHAENAYWLVRAHVARALGLAGDATSIPAIRRRVEDKSMKVRIAAMDALARFGDRGGPHWEVVADNLGAASWPVRSAAADCLGAMGRMDAVEPLIARMEIESGRVREDIHAALKAITRDDLGRKPEYWRDWWEKEKARNPGRLPERGKGPKGASKGAKGYDTPTYYGLRVYSRGIGYVIDTSGSMAYVIRLDGAWLKRQNRSYPTEAAKHALARQEVEASLRKLDPRTKFNVYFFRTVVSSLSGKMLAATPANVDKALRRIDTEVPRFDTGQGAAYRTNYVDVFRKLLSVKSGALPPPGFSGAPDTIFFLTDGKPTAGDITQPDALRSWFREMNRFERIRVHVITFGSTEIDPVFLGGLATDNGGVFVQVPAATK
ncbi:MAG: HEAT repeat domain-containing protein [Planctomycetota bacterium]